MKTANIDRKFLHIFWTNWGNSMKFLGKMYFEIILKATKNQGFILSLEDTLGLSWSEECIIVTGTVDNQIPTFAITDTKLFVPVVILSA